MIQTTDEKIKAALWETTRVLNQILNDSPPQVSLFDRARRAYDQATAALRDETRDKFVRDMDTPIATPSPGAGGSVGAEPAMKQFTELMSAVDESPIERLRFFCSLAMNAQDWLDVEPLFDALATPAPSVPSTGTKCHCDHHEHCSVCQPHLWLQKSLQVASVPLGGGDALHFDINAATDAAIAAQSTKGA